jgi:hypothetical protein
MTIASASDTFAYFGNRLVNASYLTSHLGVRVLFLPQILHTANIMVYAIMVPGPMAIEKYEVE